MGRLYVVELEDVLDASGPWPSLWALKWEEDNWRGLWKEISLNECLAYLLMVLGEHGLPFRAGDKTRLVLVHVQDRWWAMSYSSSHETSDLRSYVFKEGA